jgi:hypothetical protein
MYTPDNTRPLTSKPLRSADAPVARSTPATLVITPGHRALDPAELALIKRIRLEADSIRTLVNDVQHFCIARGQEPLGEDEAPHSTVTHPERWAALAQTDLQTGFMKLTRAVAAPTHF